MSDKIYLLDTSLIVALLSFRDIHHRKAIELFNQRDGIFMSHFLVFQETITVICRRINEQKFFIPEAFKTIQDFFNILMMLNEIPPQDEIIKIIEKTQCLLSFTDATLIYYANILNAEILTFDGNLLSVK
ncbi:MAG: PIN domain-containing protein [Thermodesulfovibrio sp.]|nr:PIN domain-containing protein [Thermodesulfovibrio sp.]MDW7998206.1 PIN domain-containing protein [Thermodesulfovibrio sp.]